MARFLIAQGAAVAQVNKAVAPDGSTLVHKLLLNKQPELVLLLLDAGVDYTVRTKNKSTYLHIAGWSGLLGELLSTVHAQSHVVTRRYTQRHAETRYLRALHITIPNLRNVMKVHEV